MSYENLQSPRFEKNERKDWGVALNVSKECEQEAFRIRDAILDRGVTLVARLEQHPHITLFQGELSSDSRKAIECVVEELRDQFFQDHPEELVIQMEDNLHFRTSNNNIFWNVQSSEWLTALHISLDERLRALPEWNMMKQFRDRIQKGGLTPAEVDHIKKYGVLSAGALFLPHVTVGKLANGADFERIKDVSVSAVSFHVRQVIAGAVDRYGQIENVEITNEMRK